MFESSLSVDHYPITNTESCPTSNLSTNEPIRKIIGNREDLTILYRKARDLIWQKKIYEVFNVSVNNDSSLTVLTVMNLWKLCKSVDAFWLEEFNFETDSWDKVSINRLGQFPTFNVYPVVSDLGYIHGIVQKATSKIITYLGFKDLKDHIDEKSLSKGHFISIIDKYFRKVVGKENLEIKAKMLRTQFYSHFYDREVVRALMSVDYKYVGFFQYIQCLVYRNEFIRVVKERKNLLPVFLKINSTYWTREDIFSKKIWCKLGKKSKLCDQKRFSAKSIKTFHSFESVSVFRWLFSQKTTVIKAWVEHRNVELDVIKLAVESASKSPAAYALVSLMRNVDSDFVLIKNHRNEMIFLYRAFLNESNAVWETEGYPALRKWITLNIHRMKSFYDYLLDGGFETGALNKKTTWLSIKNKSDEWHKKKAEEREAQMLLIRLNREKLEWVSLIKNIEINDVKFSAIDTYTRLYQEAVDMHHCVDTYLEDCLEEHYRVFHAEDSKGNKATLGISLSHKKRRGSPQAWCIDQVQAECNELTTKPIATACEALLVEYNRLWTDKNSLIKTN